MNKFCPAKGCKSLISENQFLCRAHMCVLPVCLYKSLIKNYSFGPVQNAKWHEALNASVEWIQQNELKTVPGKSNS